MKLVLHFNLAVLFVFAIAVDAQTSPSPSITPAQTTQTTQNAVEPSPSPTASVSVEPPSLIPANILPGPDAAALPAEPLSPDLQLLNGLFKQSSLGAVADEHRLHVQLAALEVRLRNDEDLHALKAFAERAPTDLEKRHRLRTYFQAYYKKVSALADTPELQAYVTARKAGDESLLLQPRTRHETDEAEAARLAVERVGAPTTTTGPAPSQAPVNDILRSDDNTPRP